VKQDNIARYQEILGREITITVTPTDPDIFIVGSIDGSAANFKQRTVAPNGVVTFSFDMSQVRHRTEFQPLFQFTSKAEPSVTYTISCDHGDEFDGGTRKKTDNTESDGFTFKQQP